MLSARPGGGSKSSMPRSSRCGAQAAELLLAAADGSAGDGGAVDCGDCGVDGANEWRGDEGDDGMGDEGDEGDEGGGADESDEGDEGSDEGAGAPERHARPISLAKSSILWSILRRCSSDACRVAMSAGAAAAESNWPISAAICAFCGCVAGPGGACQPRTHSLATLARTGRTEGGWRGGYRGACTTTA